LIVSPAWQPREPFIFEDLRDSDRTEWMSLVAQVTADVVDGEVLLSHSDDVITEGIGFGCGLGPLGWCAEVVATGIQAELVDKDATAARSVTEAASDFGAREPLDDESPKGLVLAMGGVGGFEEDAGEIR